MYAYVEIIFSLKKATVLPLVVMTYPLKRKSAKYVKLSAKCPTQTPPNRSLI